MRVIGALYFIFALGRALASSSHPFLVCRFLTGIAIGASSVLAPVYLAEIAPANRRGIFVGLFQVSIVIGILMAYGSNFLVDQLAVGPDAWSYMVAVSALPAAALFGLMFTIPHSPRWLAAKDRLTEAESSFQRLGSRDPRGELDGFSIARASLDKPARRLWWIEHRRSILLALGLASFNQLSGINAVLYYWATFLPRLVSTLWRPICSRSPSAPPTCGYLSGHRIAGSFGPTRSNSDRFRRHRAGPYSASRWSWQNLPRVPGCCRC